MPNTKKIRVWTDVSGSFKVEAEFIGLNDGKIHLHKNNGVKIAVPVTKMSLPDLEYVEKAAGSSIDEAFLASLSRRRAAKDASSGASVQKKVEYDWFDFFLHCGVSYQICERYAAAFRRDEMSEENMPDITPELLRTLGVKEGDILRIMKFLDQKFARGKGELHHNVRRQISTNWYKMELRRVVQVDSSVGPVVLSSIIPPKRQGQHRQIPPETVLMKLLLNLKRWLLTAN